MESIRIYVAGPYTKGDVCLNVKAAVEVADRLLHAGFAPYIPHLTHFWHLLHPHPWEDWMGLDLAWLPQCHALLRLPGESKGAEIEELKAKECGLPVFRTVGAVVEYFAERNV